MRAVQRRDSASKNAAKKNKKESLYEDEENLINAVRRENEMPTRSDSPRGSYGGGESCF